MQIDRDLLKIVFEDLAYLSFEWNRDIDDVSLRRASVLLRSLLIEGKLLAVAKEIGLDIRVLTPAILKAYTVDELKGMHYYQAGGAKYKGITVQPLSVVKRAKTPEEIKADYEKEKELVERSYPVRLSEFIKLPSFVIRGVIINRAEVIKYVANKLGGAHYDSTRRISLSGTSGCLEEKYVLLDNVRNSTEVADKNAIYYELLSIGQHLVNSRDIQKLQKKLKNILFNKA